MYIYIYILSFISCVIMLLWPYPFRVWLTSFFGVQSFKKLRSWNQVKKQRFPVLSWPQQCFWKTSAGSPGHIQQKNCGLSRPRGPPEFLLRAPLLVYADTGYTYVCIYIYKLVTKYVFFWKVNKVCISTYPLDTVVSTYMIIYYMFRAH